VERLTVEVLVVIFFASIVRSAFGFGEALIAVPLLALFLPIRVAAPLAVLISVVIAAVILAQDWRKVHLRSSGWLFIPTLAGIPVGIWLLRSANPLSKAAVPHDEPLAQQHREAEEFRWIRLSCTRFNHLRTAPDCNGGGVVGISELDYESRDGIEDRAGSGRSAVSGDSLSITRLPAT
jgi:hypothetical protein